MVRPPIDLRCGVSIWQSIISPPFSCMNSARKISASLLALGTSENMLSPMKQRPSVTP